MPQAIESNLFLYDDDFYLGFQEKDVIEIEKQLNIAFTNNNEQFVDNRLSIYIGKCGSKSILFASKHKGDSKTRHYLQEYTNQTIFKGHIFSLHIR